MLFSVDLGDNGGQHDFQDLDDVDEWLKVEEHAWGWISNGSVNGDTDLRNRFFSPLNDIRRSLNDARNNQTADTTRALHDSIESAFTRRKGPYHSTSVTGRFVLDLGMKDAEAGLGALIRLTEMVVHINRSPMVRGMMSAELFLAGVRTGAPPELAALASLREQHRGLIAETRLEMDKTSESLEVLRKGHADDLQALSIGARQTWDSLQTSITEASHNSVQLSNDALDDVKARIEAMEKSYREEISLRESVTYWQDRRKQHRLMGWVFSIGTVLVAAIGGDLLYKAGAGFFPLVAPTTSASAASASLATVPAGVYFRFVTLGVCLALYLWSLRIGVRLLLGQLHQGEDAGERVVMLKTYLALASEGKVTDVEDRKLILGALFRHGTSGIVSDDASPTTPLEAFGRILTGK